MNTSHFHPFCLQQCPMARQPQPAARGPASAGPAIPATAPSASVVHPADHGSQSPSLPASRPEFGVAAPVARPEARTYSDWVSAPLYKDWTHTDSVRNVSFYVSTHSSVLLRFGTHTSHFSSLPAFHTPSKAFPPLHSSTTENSRELISATRLPVHSPAWPCPLNSLHHPSPAAEPGTTPPPQLNIYVGLLSSIYTISPKLETSCLIVKLKN